jgi:CubicO group peptidase (beta-lactamase class C family)
MTVRRVGLVGACVLAGCATTARGPAATTTPPPRAQTQAAAQLVEAPAATEAFADPRRRARLAAAFPELDAFLATERTKRNLPSLAFGVVIDGELAFAHGYGARDASSAAPVDADTIYRIGSITKTFTSLAVLKLRDEGKLSLDEPVTRYLPELASVRYPTRDAPAITLRHLLTHSSGLPRLGPFNYAQADHDVTEPEMLEGLRSVALMTAPGTEVRYSNFGFGLVGLVVSRVSGQRYRDYVDAAILGPLGMSSTRWSATDVPADRLATAYERRPMGTRPVAHWRLGASEAAGGLYSSVRDLARYVAFQLDAYPPRSDEDRGPVRRSSRREAHTPQRATDLTVKPREPGAGDGPPDARAVGVGLAWWGQQTCAYEQIVGHTGGTEGYTALVRFLPQRGLGLIALTNLGEAELDGAVDGALTILARTGALELRTFTSSPALAHGLATAVALYDDFSSRAYAEGFVPAFRAANPEAAVVALIAALKAAHGRCDGAAARILSVQGPGRAVFSVPCARGALEFLLGVDGAGKVTLASVSPSAAAPPRDRCAPREP